MSTQTDAATILRGFAVASLVDAVTITEPDAKGTLNPSTGQIESGTSTTIYSGAALVRPSGGDAAMKMFGQEQISLATHVVVLPPIGVTDVGVGQTIEVTASLLDTELVGKKLTIRAIHFDSYNTMRIALCGLNLGGGPSVG